MRLTIWWLLVLGCALALVGASGAAAGGAFHYSFTKGQLVSAFRFLGISFMMGVRSWAAVPSAVAGCS